MQSASAVITTTPVDEFTYESNASQTSIKNDHICIPDDHVITKLAVSQGIAQSTKLEQYEAHVQSNINSTAYIPENIANTGKSELRRKQLAKL
ncbi:MAG: RMD1 family protein [Gammaproteobacteria bacterium]|nr:RMD1 family protein [Gammaproteobacteria bacterium]